MQRRRLMTATAGAVLLAASPVAFSEEKPMSRILIAFYSRRGENYWSGGTKNLAVGNTERLAQKIQALVGGDLYEIDTVKPYPANYRETTRVAETEISAGARPELKYDLPDLTQYDVVFLGHPIWWGQLPPAVQTFLDGTAAAAASKTVAQFCTHAGSGFAQTPSQVKTAWPGARFADRYSVYGTDVDDSDADVRRWLEKIGLLK